MQTNTTRIAKENSASGRIFQNTLMLYFRYILILLVSLYTVRVILNTLGAEDYGIYSVVAGVVTMFGFLSSAMAGTSQRFFSIELGRNNIEQLKRVFSLILTIYILIAFVVFLLAETIGLWFVSHKLLISPERKSAALWVYHFSIISFLFTILTSPYMAAITAHEDMSVYAYVSILEVILKLVVVFFLQYFTADKLKLYGILYCLVTILITTVYKLVCSHKYCECRFRPYWNSKLFKEIIGYAGWNLYSPFSVFFQKQSIDILLNQLFNPVVVTSRNLAYSVTSAVSVFFNQFSTAIRPQIFKTYANGEKEKLFSLVVWGTKMNFFLIYIFSLPLFLEMNTVLIMWLKNPPGQIVLFTRLMLVFVMLDAMTYSLDTAIHATGRIVPVEFISGTLFVLNFPLAWFALSAGAPVYSIFIISIVILVMVFTNKIVFARHLVGISTASFFLKIIVPIFFTSIVSSILPILFYIKMEQGFIRLCVVTGISIVSVCCCMYLIGLNNTDRQRIKNIVLSKLFAVKNT